MRRTKKIYILELNMAQKTGIKTHLSLVFINNKTQTVGLVIYFY